MRAQSSIEFIILVGAVLLFTLGFFLVLSQTQLQKSQSQERLIVEDLAVKVQEEIRLASAAAEGYERIFDIPQVIAGKEYTIRIVEGLVYIETLDGKNALALPVKDVQGDLIKGQNLIKKYNNTVLLNP